MKTDTFLDRLGDIKRENAIERFGMTEEQANAFVEAFKEGFCTAMNMVAENDPRDIVSEIEFYNNIFWEHMKAEWALITKDRDSQKQSWP